MKTSIDYIILLARIFIGAILIYASISKIIAPGEFARAIDNYHLIPFGLENSLAIVLPWLELITGICLILGVFVDGAAFITMFMMTIFIIAISYAIISGYNIECGCGLKPGEMVGIKKIFEDFIYWVLALLILKRPNRKFEIYPKSIN